MTESVAVIMPAHNRSELLRISLQNVICQQDVKVELAVIDDASEDDSRQVIADFAANHPNIKTERFTTPQGACAARNRGLELTGAPFVCFLDSDDLMHPEKLARQVELLKRNPDVDLAVCQMAHFSDDPNQAEVLWNTFEGDPPRSRFLRHDPVWGIHAPLWRRGALERIGGFDPSLPMAQDYEIHTRALLRGCKALLHRDLLTYCRTHSEPSIGSSRAIARLKTLMQLFDTFHQQLEPLQNEDREALIGNYMWLASRSAILGEGQVMSDSMIRAAKLLGKWSSKFARFGLLCRATLISRKDRLSSLTKQAAQRMGVDVRVREEWHQAHRVSDEPGLVSYPMPGSCWRA